jgi:periplasmic protein TonB
MVSITCSNQHAMNNTHLYVSSDGDWQAPDSFVAGLLGEERPRDMLILLTVLVLLLHVCLLTWLKRPGEAVTEAKPLTMEVSMIAISAPKPALAPPQPSPPPEKKTPPKKVQPKPAAKKPPPIVQKAPDFAPTEPAAEAPIAAPAAASAAASSTSQAPTAAAAATETFTEANFRANYAHNPKPEYPMVAKSRGWAGKVLLRVKVSAQGSSDAVAVEKSSGYDLLDESAIEAVKQWRFIPAKRGEASVASSVIVPIIFNLRD